MKSRIVWTVAGLLCLKALICFLLVDRSLLQFMNEHPTDFHRNFWVNGFRQLGKAWVPIWLLLLWTYLERNGKVLLIGMLSLGIVAVMVSPPKMLIPRFRPETAIKIKESGKKPKSFTHAGTSFPSGDTASAFALAVALVPLVSAPAGAGLIAAAVGVGLLRIVSLDHYLSDVCVGAAIGFLAGWITHIIYRRWNRIDPGIFNGLHWRRGLLITVVAMPIVLTFIKRFNPIMIFLEAYGILVLLFVLWYIFLKDVNLSEKPAGAYT